MRLPSFVHTMAEWLFNFIFSMESYSELSDFNVYFVRFYFYHKHRIYVTDSKSWSYIGFKFLLCIITKEKQIKEKRKERAITIPLL